MKRNYIAPQTAVYQMTLNHIIAESDPKVGINKSGEVDADKVDTKGSGTWNIWGDDDNE